MSEELWYLNHPDFLPIPDIYLDEVLLKNNHIKYLSVQRVITKKRHLYLMIQSQRVIRKKYVV